MSWAGDVDVAATYSAVLDAACSTAQSPVRVSGGVITQGVSEAFCAWATSGTRGVGGSWRRVSRSVWNSTQDGDKQIHQEAKVSRCHTPHLSSTFWNIVNLCFDEILWSGLIFLASISYI